MSCFNFVQFSLMYVDVIVFYLFYSLILFVAMKIHLGLHKLY